MPEDNFGNFLKREAKEKARAERIAQHYAERNKSLEFHSKKKAVLHAMNMVPKPKPIGQQAPDFRLMTEAELAEWAKALTRADKYDWDLNARPDQRFPEGAVIWLLLGGRGSGKTRSASEKVRQVCETPNMSVAMVAKDHRALRDVCLEGRSGLLAVIPPELIKKVHKGLGDVSIELTNGSMIRGYTAGEPDAVRGQSFDMIWGDEFAAWPKNRAADMLKQLRLCMRESKVGAICILSTTPKRIPHVVDMIKLAENPEERIVITRSRSRDNTALSEEWHRQMERELGGTRLGRQELDGELVMDVELALWTGRMIDEARWDPDDPEEELPPMVGVMTGVDPSGSKDGDATGIVTIGWDRKLRLYVLDNRTTKGEPETRYRAVCQSALEYNSFEIWYESAYGGDNAAYGIEQAWKNMVREGLIPASRPMPAIKPSTIKGDKAARAMPVVALYEQQQNNPEVRRIFHVPPSGANQIAQLEDEMLTWSTDEKKSPNAIDAMVHCASQIMRRTGQMPASINVASTKRRIGGGFNPFGGSR